VTLEGKVRSVLLLQPRGGNYAALLAFFREHDILGLAVREAGCLSSEVQVPLSGAGPVMVTAVWQSADAYAGWRNHPVRNQFSGDMQRLTEPEAPPAASGLYTVAITADAAR
jgi:heme-degrading monooxygenase HmoA